MGLSPIQQQPFQQLPQPAPPEPIPQHTWRTRLRDGVLAASNVADLPGSTVRDILSGRNPFDQWLDPLGYRADQNRITGQGLLQHHGLLGQGNGFWNHAAGIGTEVLTDPLTALFAAGKIAPVIARLSPKKAAVVAQSPLVKRVSRLTRRLPSNQLHTLFGYNMLARADPILYAMDSEAQQGG